MKKAAAGKREAENEIDKKLLSRKKHERAKVVATDDEDLPRPKKLRLIASAKHDSSSSEEEEESLSSENDTAVESSSSSEDDEQESSSDGSSSEDDTEVESSSSSEENDAAVESSSNIIAAAESSDVIAAASKKEGKSTSDDHQVKKTSEQLNHSDSDKGKAVVDTCGDHEEIHCREGEEPRKENETEFLIAILYVELVIHEKDVNQIDWTLIVQKLYNQTRKQTSVTQVQTLYKKFRDETNQFMDLLQVTGYEWNPNNNKVTCKDHVWEHIYWIHGGDKLFRKKGLLHYNLLRDIFSSRASNKESHVQRIVHTTPPLTSTRIWSWLFGKHNTI